MGEGSLARETEFPLWFKFDMEQAMLSRCLKCDFSMFFRILCSIPFGPNRSSCSPCSSCNLSLLREALLEHFQMLPLEVLKVLCAKVCYLDVPSSACTRMIEHILTVNAICQWNDQSVLEVANCTWQPAKHRQGQQGSDPGSHGAEGTGMQNPSRSHNPSGSARLKTVSFLFHFVFLSHVFSCFFNVSCRFF